MTKRWAVRISSARRLGSLALACAFACLLLTAPAARSEITVPPGFQASTLDIPRAEEAPADFLTGLQYPTAIDFGPDGSMLVAERSGRVMLFDSSADVSPTLIVDINPDVMARGDRGLLGLKLDPEFPAEPYLYLAYTHDAPIGGQAPAQSDDPISGGDACDESPPFTGCVASGRIVSLELDPTTYVPVGGVTHPVQNVLVESWCQQFLSHSIGDIEFDSSGALLAGGGDGANWEIADHGQYANACGDPPNEGGSLRDQDLRTPADPTDYNGSIIRIDRFTGEALDDNPLYAGADVRARRILAFGFRNPFRFEFRPGTDELYVGDVGWYTWEELDRLESPPAPEQGALNFGWPCYEGFEVEPDWAALASNDEAPLCKSLYTLPPGSVTYPIFEYGHGMDGEMFPGDTCQAAYGASVTGLAFYEAADAPAGHAFPESYDGALFLADSSRGCIWVMHAGPDGVPDPAQITNFATTEGEGGPYFTPVDITVGPDGALYIPNFFDSSIERIQYFAEGQPPVAKLDADHTFGPSPLDVHLDASGSVEPDGEDLHYSWDLNGDGNFGEGPDAPSADVEFSAGENVSVAVRVSDELGNSDDARLTIYPGDLGPPEPEIEADGEEWTIGDTISFAGKADDPDEEDVRLDWNVTIRHCPTVTACHSHPLTSFTNVASGELKAPSHEYPSHLLLTLTAHDERGLSKKASRELYPRLITVRLASDPPGIPLSLNGNTAPSPVDGVMIAGGSANISAPQAAVVNGHDYEFSGWSDDGARTRTFTSTGSAVLTARYRQVDSQPGDEEHPPEPRPPVDVLETPPPPHESIALRLRSRPAGVLLRVGGLGRRAPFATAFGSDRRIWVAAPRRTTVGHRRLRFRRWSNGGARRQWVGAGEYSMLRAIYKVVGRTHRNR